MLRPSLQSVFLRRFHGELRRLKAVCEYLSVELKSNDNADANDICILSTNDYNLLEPKANCSDKDESYFLSPAEYEIWDEYEAS